MELHQLKYVVAIAETGNFTRAAEKCFVSQPSLSQQVIKLEKELGGPLFDRTGRKVQLTDAGRLFCERAVEILAAVDAAKREWDDDREGGRLSLGAIPTVAPYLLPPLLKPFRRRFPRAEVTVYEDLTEHTLRACRAGDLDVALLALPIDDDQLVVEPLFEEELLLAMTAGHHLSRKRRLTMDDIREEPFVLLSETHCLGEQIISFCRQQSCLPAVSCHSAKLLTVQELVALGHGVSFIPQMAVRADKSKKRVYRSLSADRPTRTIAMIWRKNRYQSRLVQQFIEQIRKELSATNRSATRQSPARRAAATDRVQSRDETPQHIEGISGRTPLS